MKSWAWALPLLAATSHAAIVETVPRFNASPMTAGVALLPALAAPSLSAVPAPIAAPAFSATSLAAVAPAPAPAAAAALTPAPGSAASAPRAGAGGPSAERAAQEASLRFDGGAADWSRGTFESPDGLEVSFKRRAGPAGSVPRVYAGGLALNESFDSLFARSAAPVRPEYFVWSRGHRPTGWTPTSSVLDADARDLARMIVLAARESGSPKIELAAHSFGAVVFQRMLQLRAEPEVGRALKLLAGSRVVLLNGMTHYDDVEKLGGPAVEQMAQATRAVVDWLDSWDALAAQFTRALDNPFLAMQAHAWLAGYRYQREQLLSTATHAALGAMRADLEAPWEAAMDSIRRGFLSDLAKNARDPEWQEALLRRSRDSFVLDFKTSDARFLRGIGVKLELVHSLRDQLLNWQAARLLFERLGIAAPAAAPPAGTELKDPSGLFRAAVVDADHYYPLKQRDDLARRLDP